MSFRTWIFLWLRSWLTPYGKASRFVPRSGKILDLGCGHALFSILLATQSREREILGIDHDPKRVVAGRLATADLKNLRLQTGSIEGDWPGPFRSVILFDVLHYLTPPNQEALISKAVEALEPGGVFLVREIDPGVGFASRFNRWYERIATRNRKENKLYFRSSSQLTQLLSAHGLSVYSTSCSAPFFADILYVCRKPGSPKSLLPTLVTADDWGMSPAINSGILSLAKSGIVKRVSIMANGAHVDTYLKELLALPEVSLGLHWDLTSQTGSPWGVFTNRVDPAHELKRQLQRLQSRGISVSYLDSHHHVHLLPGKLAAVAPMLREHGIHTVRIPYDPALWLTLKFPLNVLSLFAGRTAKRLGFRFLPCVYPQARHFQDPEKLKLLLEKRGIVEAIVHPADADDLAGVGSVDLYRSERVLEFHALSALAYP